MYQTQELIATLKKLLKSEGLTYRELARKLEISESSIKRLFAEESFSLKRVDQICHHLGINLSDLVHMMDRENPRITQLTEAQEKEAASDLKLLGIAFLVMNGWSYQNILENFSINEATLVHYLFKLDKLRILDLLPNNRIRLLISSNFSWRKNGPVQKTLANVVLRTILEGDIENAGGEMHYLPGMLSDESRAEIIRRIGHLAQSFKELKQQDRDLPFEQRHGYSLVLAIRPWRKEVINYFLTGQSPEASSPR
ncbi:MAG: helix-turn-helix transcriptional regulator [Betaproteobacteria bacterium]|nr:helix-turn-helix transcriptional regulator [Betaproteobacteria bacterium]